MSCAASKVVTVALATIMFVPTARMASTSQGAGRKVAQPTDYGTLRWVGKGSNGCSALARKLICMRVQRFALAVIDEVSMMMGDLLSLAPTNTQTTCWQGEGEFLQL